MTSRARSIMSSFPRILTSSYPNHLAHVPTSSSDRVIVHQKFVTHNFGYRYLCSYPNRMQTYSMNRRNFSVYNGAGASLPSEPPSSSSSPLNWILGIILSIILPFFGNKWGPLLQFKKEVDTAVDTIEEIVDVVEKVAEVVDKVAEDISHNLPDGGNLKKVVDAVEDVAEETVKDAHVVGDAIDKFQQVEDEVENIVGTLSDHKGNENQNIQEAKA